MATNIDNDEESLHDFLKRKNLEKYLPQFEEQGAVGIQDVLDGVDKHVLVSDIGMTTLEANKFLKLIEQYKVSCCAMLIYVLGICSFSNVGICPEC